MVLQAGDWSSSGLPQTSPGPSTFSNHPKRKPGYARNGSSLENPIEIDGSASKKASRSRKSAPALPQSPEENAGPSSGNRFPVAQWKSFSGHPWQGGLPSSLQYPQAVPEAYGYHPQPAQPQTSYYQQPAQPQNSYYQQPAQPQTSYYQQPAQPQTSYYQQPAQPQTSYYQQPSQPHVSYCPQLAQPQIPAAVPGQPMENIWLRHNPYSMTAPPAFVQPSMVFGDSPVATAQQFSQEISHTYIQQPKHAPNIWSAHPEKFEPSYPNHIFELIRAARSNHHPEAATDFDEQFSLKPGICDPPLSGIDFSECSIPSGDWLLDFGPEQIVSSWVGDWDSRGLLEPEGLDMFKRHG